MRSAVQEVAAHVVGHAMRQKSGVLEYDDAVTRFCADLPFAALRARIRTKWEEAGLAFAYASGRELTDPIVDQDSAVGRRRPGAVPDSDLSQRFPGRDIAVLVPELVERHWYHYFLHNQRVLKAPYW
jgi:hypothetical protein